MGTLQELSFNQPTLRYLPLVISVNKVHQEGIYKEDHGLWYPIRKWSSSLAKANPTVEQMLAGGYDLTNIYGIFSDNYSIYDVIFLLYETEPLSFEKFDYI